MGFKDNETTAPAETPAPDNGGYAQAGEYNPGGASKKVIPILAIDHPDFRLLYHPLRWGFFQATDGASGEWLPLLHRLPLTPGCGNVDKDGDPSTAYGIAQVEGWSVILPSAEDSYIAPYDAKGGTAYLSRWQRVKVLGTVAFVSSDETGYRAWLRDLCRRRGWKPDADVIAMKRMQLESEVAMDGGDSTDPKGSARAKRGQKTLDAMDGKKAAPAKKEA